MQKLVITTITGGLLAASSAVAGDFSVPVPVTKSADCCTKIGGTLSADYANVYHWRGLNLGNDLTSTSLELNGVYQGLEWTAGGWYGSIEDTGNTVRNYNSDELDLYGSISKDFGVVKATVGYIHYKHFNDGVFADIGPSDDAQEMFFGISKDLYGYSASLKYFWAIETANYGYTELALGKTFNVFANHAVDLNATLGYLANSSELSHLTVQASYDIPVGCATLTPYAAHVWELEGLERASAYASEDNEFIAGLRLSVDF